MVENMFEARLTRFRKLMEEHLLDAFLVAAAENRYYLSGYEAEDLQLTESSGYLLITPKEQYLLTDPRYEEAAGREAAGYSLVVYRQGLSQVLPDLFGGVHIERLGVESDYLTYQRYRDVERLLKQSRPGAEVVGFDGMVERLRIIKEPLETDRIRTSLRLTEKVLCEVWEGLRPGRTEKEIAWEIERRIREEGAENVSFPSIVAGGPNAALPHAVPTERRISEGDPVVFDIGSKLNHYCSDISRTWVAGSPGARLKEIYAVVREAQLTAQNIIRAGLNTAEADRAARDVIQRAGYGERFGHGLGHGVGLSVHEGPGLRQHNPTVLEENMVVTVEPGIYIPGFGGVRLENMVRVTADGCELLNDLDLFYQW